MANITFRYYSEALGRQTSCQILLPQSLTGKLQPVLLLHGLSDDETGWMRYSRVEKHAEAYPFLVVMPDGGRGFYVDAVQGEKFGTNIGVELPKIIEGLFPVQETWAISGLSMGGFGAVAIGLRQPEKFRSIHAMSAALDVEERKKSDEFMRIFGDHKGTDRDIYHLANSAPNFPALRLDCGTEDHLLNENRVFYDYLRQIGKSAQYEEFPGGHTWEYWDLHVQDGFAFHAKNLL